MSEVVGTARKMSRILLEHGRTFVYEGSSQWVHLGLGVSATEGKEDPMI
jgi:hypothetical protein